MTQPPQPPQPPRQPGFGPPPEPSEPSEPPEPEQQGQQRPEPSAPQAPAAPQAQPGFGPPPEPSPTPQPQTPPAQQPPSAPGGPDLSKTPEPGYGHPQAPQPPQQSPQAPPQTPPPTAPAPGGPQPPPGYGYPQQPPAGYGYPQQPPAGYGYPGQPRPGQPGGHGQPQPPYGYPQQPYGQPGYGGYLQQPTMPMQPQPGRPGGGRKINAQLAIVVAAVVAIALIVGSGVWYASSSGDDKKNTANSGDSGDTKGAEGGGSGGDTAGGDEKAPADPSAKVLFQVPAPKVPKDTTTIVTSGSWLTDKVYAKSGVAEVVGYDAVKGSELWTLDLPGPVCEASDHATEDGRTAIIYKPKMPTKTDPQRCTQVAAFDLATGEKLWSETARSGTQEISFNNVTVSGNTVAAGSTSGGAAWDITSGKSLWTPKTSDACYDSGYGGGPKMVAVRKCGSYDQRQLHIQTIDPKDGKVISEYRMTEGIEYAAVVSTDPLVVAADVGDSAGDGSGISDFFSIDNKSGELRTRISAPGEEFAARCDGITKIEHCTGLTVGNDRLYIATEEHDGTGEHSRTNEVVVFDLSTGKQTGQRADAGDGYRIVPLRMDGNSVIAYKRPPYDKGGQIVSIDGGSLKETKLLENPATESVRDVETRMSPDYSEILYSQGSLYMSDVYASELSSGDKEYLAVAFGTG
ncbi:PQQ-binding-like beta-propeller repeat protein [Streptomyces sp. NEAU-W12]|uniref:outer membrane protein assembly factor BamB family protein n=1 Tax=Streptomyces sp. NEAU-W12 TaxID=2994668 RepID=UPI00224A6F78|nr:PQQ-binding-like beta-propeller repeat protein [Streptomyces sp. NEAU-W12]MCX2926579.1 PQQ-binding-like beta-propeller repeat protein [Streptomyces sp. NEAU-W12]